MLTRFNISIERVDGRRNIEVHNKWFSRLFDTIAFTANTQSSYFARKCMFEDISFADDQLYCSNNHQVQNNTEFYVAVQRES